MFKVDIKGNRATSFCCLYCQLWTYFTPFFGVSIVHFAQVNLCKVNVGSKITENNCAINSRIPWKVQLFLNFHSRNVMPWSFKTDLFAVLYWIFKTVSNHNKHTWYFYHVPTKIYLKEPCYRMINSENWRFSECSSKYSPLQSQQLRLEKGVKYVRCE